MPEEHLLIERRSNGVVVATLNRPEKLNALSQEIRDGLRTMAADLSRDSAARALIITGAGRGFCSGADLSNREERVAAEAQPGLGSTALRYGLAAELQALDIPTIAAINGAAAGAGFAISLACDMRIMSERARLHPAFMRIGLGPGLGRFLDAHTTDRTLTGARDVLACRSDRCGSRPRTRDRQPGR